VISVYTLGIAVATVAGAACGGLLLRSLGETREAYAAVFVGSCLLRAAVLPLLRSVGRSRLPDDRGLSVPGEGTTGP
jgi:predicted MFS family arabinose efflux permease